MMVEVGGVGDESECVVCFVKVFYQLSWLASPHRMPADKGMGDITYSMPLDQLLSAARQALFRWA